VTFKQSRDLHRRALERARDGGAWTASDLAELERHGPDNFDTVRGYGDWLRGAVARLEGSEADARQAGETTRTAKKKRKARAKKKKKPAPKMSAKGAKALEILDKYAGAYSHRHRRGATSLNTTGGGGTGAGITPWIGLACWSEVTAWRELRKAIALGYLAPMAGTDKDPKRATYVRTRKAIPEACAPRAPRAPAAPRLECYGECGRWRAEKGTPGTLAIGPAVPVYDDEGREYPARLELRELSAAKPSHEPRSFSATPGYPQELQARARAGKAARLQVATLAGGLEPLRMVAPSSNATDGPPVVWGQWITSGNGRAMALARWQSNDEKRGEYRVAVGRRWRSRALARVLEGARGPLIVVRALVGATKAQAVALAGASQGTQSAGLNEAERAASRARSSGTASPLELGAFRWTEEVTPITFGRFKRANREWWAAAVQLVSPAKRTSLEDPELGARHVRDLLAGGLPAGALDITTKNAWAAEALAGSLPGIWTTESEIGAGRVFARWSLLEHLKGAARWYLKAGRKSIQALSVDVDAEDRQLDIIPEAEAALHGADPLSVALAVLLIRAGRRVSPERAAAGYMARYVEAAQGFDPRTEDLFGSPSEGDPAAELADIVRFKFKRRPNPEGCCAGARTPRWVELGREVSFELEDGRTVVMDQEWRLATQPAMRSLFLVRVGPRAELADAITDASARAVEGWTWGEQPGEAYAAERPDGARVATIGRISAVLYRGRLAGGGIRRWRHRFKSRLPRLTELSDGLTIDRGRPASRYRVTKRGIVG